MITPNFSLTATERVLPKLALDFTTASLDPRVTITRALNTATRINATGIIETVNADNPRFDYDPITLTCKGLLIEESRKNLLLNTASLSTQGVTVTAVAHTISFYGTGQIVLSGTHSATVIGTGVYPSRKTYTFTPTAGTLTATVTGTVQYAQLEIGTFETSYIPNAGTQNTRNADVVTMTGTNFSSWYNTNEGAFAIQAIRQPAAAVGFYPFVFAMSGTTGNSVNFYRNATSKEQIYVNSGGAAQAVLDSNIVSGANAVMIQTYAYKTNSFASSANASTPSTDTLGTVPLVTSAFIGCDPANINQVNGWIQRINYWPQRITNNETQAFSK